MLTDGATTRTTAALPVERLRWTCDPSTLGVASTDDVLPLEGTIGQDRGLEAIAFGLAIDRGGFNLFVVGPPGSGRTTTVQDLVKRAAASRPAASDWCYLHNFEDPSQPVALRLPTGRGPELAHDLDTLIAAFRREIPRVFEGEQYQQRRADLAHQVQAQREQLLEQLRKLAQSVSFDVQLSPAGIATIPLLEPGKPLSGDAFELLADSRKAEIRANGEQVSRAAEEMLVVMRGIEREAHERFQALDREAMGFAVGHLLDALRTTYADLPAVLRHLDNVQSDLVMRVDEFHASEAEPAQMPGGAPAPLNESAYQRYRANALVSNTVAGGAPVVFEPNPTYYNLVGRIDYRAAMGGMQTDFRQIRPGALHRANTGYLLLHARDVLVSPFAWDALKRALRDGELRIENLGEQVSAAPTTGLKPTPIPLSVKVILIGDAQTYMSLFGLDPDFQRLFKVKAQFAPYMDRSPETIRAYAAFVAGRTRECKLLPFGADAVARVVEQGARLAEHQQRLATRFASIEDLLVEADHLARGAGAVQVRGTDVEAALAAQDRRLSLVEDELQREIDEGTIAIDTHAEVVGQVNGLSVMESGDFAFARPSRITARVGPGEEGLVDIEREVQLSGPTHSKGILILSGYLLEQYARAMPLALSARLTFEQVYGPVDGDSASSAELYALLSDLARLPIHQGIAVTGSVNQRGEVQAIGAVTTKVEGFFAVCKAQGLDGSQGVVVPATNARHLMLKSEVLEAVAAGKFNVWAVRTIDEGIEILTGVRAATVHELVHKRLEDFATALVQFRRRARTRRQTRNGLAGGS
jgi:predicted ATP-dependent protease